MGGNVYVDLDPLKELQSRYARAWSTHDMALLSTVFTADADWVDRSGTWMHGRDAIARGHGRVHETIYRKSSLTISDASFRFINPGVVVGHARWHVEGEIGWDGSTPMPPRYGIFTQVFVAIEGRWLIAATQSTLTSTTSGGPDEQ